jgi:hypothetical protein
MAVSTPERTFQVLAIAGRAVCFDQTQLVKTISHSLPTLTGVIDVSPEGHVRQLQPRTLSDLYASAMRIHFIRELIENDTDVPRGKAPRKLRGIAFAKWQKPWAPFNRRLVLDGVRAPDAILYSPEAQANVIVED